MNDQELIAAIRNTPTYGEEGRADLIGMGLELADALEAANRREGALRNQLTGTQGELRAAQAVIAAHHRLVFDPVSDYYGEIRERFEALGSPSEVLVAALEDAKREAWDEGLLVGQDPYGFDTTNNPYRKAE